MKKIIYLLPDGGGGFFVEEGGDVEVTAELEVGPVVEWIAEGFGDGARPGEEFVVGIGVASDEVFGDAVCAHGAPFVVVALEPELGEVGESAVGGDVVWGEVGVVINDGEFFCDFVVEELSGIGVEEEVLVEEHSN